jgi:hypothetical protein
VWLLFCKIRDFYPSFKTATFFKFKKKITAYPGFVGLFRSGLTHVAQVFLGEFMLDVSERMFLIVFENIFYLKIY